MSDIPAQVAYQCINARGAIAHGGKTGLKYDVNKEANSFRTVEEVFSLHGGTKKFHDISDIKSELMLRGPLVSASFVLTEAALNIITNPNKKSKKRLLGQF